MITIVLAFMLFQPSPEVIGHLTEACAIVWEGKSQATIDRCVGRALDSLGREERLRSNEIRQKLVRCEKDLEALKKKEEK